MDNAQAYMLLVKRFNRLSALMLRLKQTLAQIDCAASIDPRQLPLKTTTPPMSRRRLVRICRAFGVVQGQLEALHKELVQSSHHAVDL